MRRGACRPGVPDQDCRPHGAEALVFRAPAPDDRRKVLICLASKGKALYERLKILHDAQQHKLVNRLSERKADQLADILRGLIN